MTDFKSPPIYWIEWVDSMATNGWHSFSTADKELLCRTVGFLVDETDDAFAVAGSVSQTGSVLDQITIPRVAIVKMFEVVFESNGGD